MATINHESLAQRFIETRDWADETWEEDSKEKYASRATLFGLAGVIAEYLPEEDATAFLDALQYTEAPKQCTKAPKSTYNVCYRVVVQVEASDIDSARTIADTQFHNHKYTDVDGDGVFDENWDDVNE